MFSGVNDAWGSMRVTSASIGVAGAGIIVASESSYDTASSDGITIENNYVYQCGHSIGHPGILISGLHTGAQPLNDIHLENMLKLSRMGVVICPPMPGFYQRPDTIDELVTHSVVRMLDQFGVHTDGPGRWGEEFALGVTGKIPSDDSESY